MDNRAIKAALQGVAYGSAFMAITAGVVILSLPELTLSRPAIVGLLCFSFAAGSIFGLRKGFNPNT